MVAMVLKEGFKTPQNEVLATLTSCLAVRDKIVTGGNLWKHGGRLSHAELRGLVVGKERELSHTSVSLQMVRLAIQERQQWLIANGQAVDALASSTSEPPVRYVPGEGEYWHPGTATARRRVEDRVEHRMQAALAAAEQAAVEVRKLRPEPRAIPVAEVNWPAEQADPEPPHSAHPRPGRQCGSVAPRGSLHAAFGWEESGLEPIMAVGAGGYDEYYDVGEGYDATAEEYNVDGMLPVVLPGPPFPSEPIDPAVAASASLPRFLAEPGPPSSQPASNRPASSGRRGPVGPLGGLHPFYPPAACGGAEGIGGGGSEGTGGGASRRKVRMPPPVGAEDESLYEYSEGYAPGGAAMGAQATCSCGAQATCSCAGSAQAPGEEEAGVKAELAELQELELEAQAAKQAAEEAEEAERAAKAAMEAAEVDRAAAKVKKALILEKVEQLKKLQEDTATAKAQVHGPPALAS